MPLATLLLTAVLAFLIGGAAKHFGAVRFLHMLAEQNIDDSTGDYLQ